MTTTATLTAQTARLEKIAARLEEYAREIEDFACDEENAPRCDALFEARMLIDAAATILEKLSA